MKVVDGEIEIDGDDALRRAQLVKVSLEALAMAVTVVVYAQLLLRDEVKERIALRFKRWRSQFFPRPMTEDEIQQAVHQVNIEAARVLRNANES
jgi:hypothetical protein